MKSGVTRPMTETFCELPLPAFQRELALACPAEAPENIPSHPHTQHDLSPKLECPDHLSKDVAAPRPPDSICPAHLPRYLLDCPHR